MTQMQEHHSAKYLGRGMRPIRTDHTNPFARYTVSTRLPAQLADILETDTGLPPARVDAVRRLKDDLDSDRALEMFSAPAPDWDFWHRRFEEHARRMAEVSDSPLSPLNAEWFFFEHFFYRKLIEAADWWSYGIDPFAPAKRGELDGESLWASLGRTLETVWSEAALEKGEPADALAGLIAFELWGNRADLSYSAVAELGHDEVDESHLIANDLEEARHHLESPSHGNDGPVHIIADNAGTELSADLALSDYLIESAGRHVYLHVKYHPTYVSDATPPDVHELVSEMGRCGKGPAPDTVRSVGERLAGHLAEGRLRVVPDLFWNGPDFFDALPERLAHAFSSAALLIIKGDMNYRRVLFDLVPEPWTPLTEVSAPLPAPALLVRTMKGDSVAGLTKDMAQRLDAEDEQWRVNGKRGLVQYVPATE